MAFQDDHVMRTIADLAKAIGGLALGKHSIGCPLPGRQEEDTGAQALYRRIRELAGRGEINQAENLLFEELDAGDMEYLEMALAFYLYLNEFDDGFLYTGNYSREEIAEGIRAAAARFGIRGFEYFVDTTMI